MWKGWDLENPRGLYNLGLPSFRWKISWCKLFHSKVLKLWEGRGGRGREGMTHSNCILESACKRIKRQRKKKEYEMYKTESQNSERTGWVPERPEPSIATKKFFLVCWKKRIKVYLQKKTESPNVQWENNRGRAALSSKISKLEKKKRGSTDVVEPVGSPLRNQIFLVFSSSCS